MNKKYIEIIQRLGVKTCLLAAYYYRQGEGCATVGFYLNLHYKTASLAMDAGRLLPSIEEF